MFYIGNIMVRTAKSAPYLGNVGLNPPRTPPNHPLSPWRTSRLVGKQKLHNRPKAGDRQPCEWALPPGAQARSAVDFLPALIRVRKRQNKNALFR